MTETPEPTYPCNICGRKFIQRTLDKHESICAKNASKPKKRKPFDSGKQRATGSDLSLSNVRSAQKELAKNEGAFPPPKTHWKHQHKDFIANVRAAKGVEQALKTGSPLPPPVRSSTPPDYVKCDFCGRNFSEKAASRHIPFCQQQAGRKRQQQVLSASTNSRLAKGRFTLEPPKPSNERTSRSQVLPKEFQERRHAPSRGHHSLDRGAPRPNEKRSIQHSNIPRPQGHGKQRGSSIPRRIIR